MENSKKTKTIVIAVIIIAVIAAILATLYVKNSNNKEAETQSDRIAGNSTGNISNLGAVTEDGEDLFYQNGEDNFSVYKSTKGGKGVKLNSVASYFLNSMGDYIYYANADDDFNIYRMKKDGSDNQKIVTAAAYYMTVTKDNIFYVDYNNNKNIYRADIDGKNPKCIYTGEAYYLNVYNGELYFADAKLNYWPMKINPDGSGQEVILNKYVCYLVADNGYLYYTSPHNNQTNPTGDDNLYRTEISTKETEKLIGVPMGDVNVTDGKLYYVDWDKLKIFKYDLDTNKAQQLTDESGMYLNVGGDKLFYVVKENDKLTLKSIKLK